MRSYEYNMGKWAMIDSPLPSGKTIDSYGFNSETHEDVAAHGLLFRIFAKTPDHLPSGRAKNEFPYDFHCWIFLGQGLHYEIWVPDLPSLLHLLRECNVQEGTEIKAILAQLARVMVGFDTLPTISIKQEG